MFSELFSLLKELVIYLWPFRIVSEWERGLYLVFGKHYTRWPIHPTGTLQPGLKVVVPFFTEVVETSVVRDPDSTPLQHITLKDGSALSFSVTVVYETFDVKLALLTVADYTKSVMELATAILCEKLADVDPERLHPDKRGRLLSDLLRWVNDGTQDFGVKVVSLRFTNFVRNPRTLRLLADKATFSTGAV